MTMSNGTVDSLLSELYSVPKSSRAIRIPCARSSSSASFARTGSDITELSVTSRISAEGGQSPSAASTVAAKSTSVNCRGETLTAIGQPRAG